MKWAGCGSELNKLHVAWLSEKIGQGRGWNYRECPTLGIYRGGLVAVVLYHDWNPDSGVICMSAAATDKTWMTRKVIKSVHEYPFNELGCQATIMQVSERNNVMLSIAKRLGYTMHHIPRMRGRDEAEYLCLLADDTWRASKLFK